MHKEDCNGLGIIGYCDYCKGEVLSYEPYRIYQGQLFHNDKENNCFSQSQTYYDGFDDEDLNG